MAAIVQKNRKGGYFVKKSGAGKHQDRRTKRLNTRGARNRAALREF